MMQRAIDIRLIIALVKVSTLPDKDFAYSYSIRNDSQYSSCMSPSKQVTRTGHQDGHKRGSKSDISISDSTEEARVSVPDRLSDCKGASVPSVDEISLQISRGLFGRGRSLIPTSDSYACTLAAWAKTPVTSVNFGTLQQAAQVQLIPSCTWTR